MRQPELDGEPEMKPAEFLKCRAVVGLCIVCFGWLKTGGWAEAFAGTSITPPVAPTLARERSVSVRLAIGALGLRDEQRGNQLADLLAARLASEVGIELVERRALDIALREAEMSFAGLRRAKDTVRVGRLAQADWFLLGSSVSVNGTNAIILRLVEARSGVINNVAVVQESVSLPVLAEELARFVIRSRDLSRQGAPRIYLAVGGFQDLSVNNRFATFPQQLRSYLTTAYQGSTVTLLEREAVEPLLKELRLDLAGLTEAAGVPPPETQAAFWLVDGFYQSYELSGAEVDLVLRIERVFGGRHLVPLREKPGVDLLRHAREAVDGVLAKDAGPTRASTAQGEVELQMARGKALLGMEGQSLILTTPTDNFVVGGLGVQDPVKKRQNIEAATRAFETVLLLEPESRPAKLYLATCLRYTPLAQLDEARSYYREVIADNLKDEWADVARVALAYSYRDVDGRKALELFRLFGGQCGGERYAGMCKNGVVSAMQELRNANAITTPEMLPYVDELVCDNLTKVLSQAKKSGGVAGFNFNEILHACRFDEELTARHVNELLPRLKAQFPELTPFLLHAALWYQVNTNSPEVKEFRESLGWCSRNWDKVFCARSYFGQLSWSWASRHKLYDLALRIAEVRQQGITNGLAGPLSDQAKVSLGYVYAAADRWQEALAVFDSLGYRTVDVGNLGDGPWGSAFTPFSPARMADECRKHLGLARRPDDIRFELGEPFARMNDWFAFAPAGDSVWLAEDGTLFLCDASGKKTRKAAFPSPRNAPVTALAVGKGRVWIGTEGDGLFEYDAASGTCRQFTEGDGLLLNAITCLLAREDALWIGFGRNIHNERGSIEHGGFGRMDMNTHRFMAFTPSLVLNSRSPLSSRPVIMPLDSRTVEARRPSVPVEPREMVPASVRQPGRVSGEPPRRKVVGMAEGARGMLWLAVWDTGITRYSAAGNNFETMSTPDTRNRLSSLAVDESRILAGCSDPSIYPNTPPGAGFHLYAFGEAKWRRLSFQDELPAHKITALALAGTDAWIAGEGFIAVADLERDRIRKLCQVPSTVLKLQADGGLMWIKLPRGIYRIPLSAPGLK